MPLELEGLDSMSEIIGRCEGWRFIEDEHEDEHEHEDPSAKYWRCY